VLGGIHPTLFPSVIEDPAVDIVCRGEGERPFRELMNAVIAGRPYDELPGLWVKTPNGVSRNKPMPALDDLDELPPPDWSDFFNRFPIAGIYPLKSFMVGRGCVHNCSFCHNHLYRSETESCGRGVRTHSVGYVIDEILRCRSERGLGACYFMDDNFAYDSGWMDEFCRRYRSEVGLGFGAQIAVGDISEERLAKLKDAGLRYVSVALETSNERLRKEVLDKEFTNDEFLEKARLLKKYGIRMKVYVLHGIPGQTDDDYEEDMRFLSAVRPDIIHNVFLIYLPKLKVTDDAAGRGLLKEVSDDLRLFQGQQGIAISQRAWALALLFPLGVRWPVLIPLLRASAPVISWIGLGYNPGLLSKANYWICYPRLRLLEASMAWGDFLRAAPRMAAAMAYEVARGRIWSASRFY
jgi:radical SAM superfamily enzyme YgiQ (UPF0313 family)